ncbi:MAG: MerR family transcriptional regulator [bacterium]
MDASIPIGKAAEATGLSPKAIRYYEKKGLLPARPRTEGGYRLFEESDIKRLLFIRRAKELGVPLRQIAGILDLWPGGSLPPPCCSMMCLTTGGGKKITPI